MASPPVRFGHSSTSPGTYARRRCRGTASFQGSWPSRLTLPASARRSPNRMRMVVDLPAPLGPRKPWTSPCSTSRSRPSSARVLPKVLTRPRVEIAAVVVFMVCSLFSSVGLTVGRGGLGTEERWKGVDGAVDDKSLGIQFYNGVKITLEIGRRVVFGEKIYTQESLRVFV